MSETLRQGAKLSAAKAKAAAPPRELSPWVKSGVEFGPLVLFFLANSRPKLFEPLLSRFLPPELLAGPNAALFTATSVLMVSVVAALAVSFAATRRLPVVPLATAVLAVCFGALTLYLQDTTFIKMKVTVIYALFGAALFAGLAMNRLFLPFMFNNAMALTERGWRLLTVRWGAFFFALAILNEIVWRTQSNDVWVAFKFPGIFIILALFMLSQAKFIMRHQLNGEEAGKD